jgi:hypothetical protein
MMIPKEVYIMIPKDGYSGSFAIEICMDKGPCLQTLLLVTKELLVLII